MIFKYTLKNREGNIKIVNIYQNTNIEYDYKYEIDLSYMMDELVMKGGYNIWSCEY